MLEENETNNYRHTLDEKSEKLDTESNVLNESKDTNIVNHLFSQPSLGAENASPLQSNGLAPMFVPQTAPLMNAQFGTNSINLPKPVTQIDERQNPQHLPFPTEQIPIQGMHSMQAHNDQIRLNLEPQTQINPHSSQNPQSASIPNTSNFPHQQFPSDGFQHPPNLFPGFSTEYGKYQQLGTPSLQLKQPEAAPALRLLQDVNNQPISPNQIIQHHRFQPSLISNVTNPILRTDAQKPPFTTILTQGGLFPLPGTNLSFNRKSNFSSSSFSTTERQGEATNLSKTADQEVQYSHKSAHNPGNIQYQEDPSTNEDVEDDKKPSSKKTRVEDKHGNTDGKSELSLSSHETPAEISKAIDSSNIEDPQELLAVKKQIAREKNRVHSRQSRLRKKDSITKMKEVSIL